MHVHIKCHSICIKRATHKRPKKHFQQINWKSYFPGVITFQHNHHHKQVSLMRNSWSDLFLLGLVQVTNYNKTISIYGYQSHLERRLSIYLIHSHSAAPNCVFPPSCLHWQVNFLTGWKKTDFLCKGKLVIALPWKSKLGQCLFFPSNQILLTISLGICQIKRHFSLIAILLYRAGQLTKHLSRVRQLAASLEGYSISPQVIFDPSYPLRIQLFSAFLHHPLHFNPLPALFASQTTTGSENLSQQVTNPLLPAAFTAPTSSAFLFCQLTIPQEFAYLRLLALFGPDQSCAALRRVVSFVYPRLQTEIQLEFQVEPLSDRVLSSFRNHCQDKNRFPRLLLCLAPLRSLQVSLLFCTASPDNTYDILQPDLLEELFFSGLIGSVQIDSVIPYILNMQVDIFWHLFAFFALFSLVSVDWVWRYGRVRRTHWDRIRGCQGGNPITNIRNPTVNAKAKEILRGLKLLKTMKQCHYQNPVILYEA